MITKDLFLWSPNHENIKELLRCESYYSITSYQKFEELLCDVSNERCKIGNIIILAELKWDNIYHTNFEGLILIHKIITKYWFISNPIYCYSFCSIDFIEFYNPAINFEIIKYVQIPHPIKKIQSKIMSRIIIERVIQVYNNENNYNHNSSESLGFLINQLIIFLQAKKIKESKEIWQNYIEIKLRGLYCGVEPIEENIIPDLIAHEILFGEKQSLKKCLSTISEYLNESITDFQISDCINQLDYVDRKVLRLDSYFSKLLDKEQSEKILRIEC